MSGTFVLLLAVFLVSLALWFLPILSSYIMIRAFNLDAPFNAALVVFIFMQRYFIEGISTTGIKG